MPSSSIDVEIRRHSRDKPWTYEMLDRRQREIAARVREGGQGALLLSEVAPVITIGRRTEEKDLLLKPENYEKLGIQLFKTDRGGLATYHGTGQWVVFVVDSLEKLTGDRRGVRKAVDGLLQVALEVGCLYDPAMELRVGAELGAWSYKGKYAAVGIHVEDGVLLHGLSINGFQTEQSFVGLKPCGLEPALHYLLSAPSNMAFDLLGQRIVQKVFANFWRS